MDNITLKVDLVEEDYYKFQKSILHRNLSSIPLGFFTALCFLGFVLKPLLIDNYSIAEKAIRVLPAFVILAIIIIGIPNFLKRSSKAAFSTSKLLQKTQNYVINSDGIEITSEFENSYIKWNELYSAVETKDSFQFFISKAQAFLIPKRFLSEKTEELEILRKLICNAPTPKKEKKPIVNKFLFGILIYIGIILILYIMVLLLQN